jgi:hypothetical protein
MTTEPLQTIMVYCKSVLALTWLAVNTLGISLFLDVNRLKIKYDDIDTLLE